MWSLQVGEKTQQESLLFLSLLFSFGSVESFTHAGARPLVWHSPGRVCGCDGEPICSPEHHNFGHCQFSAERQQGAWSVQLQHGLHPDRCCHRRESCVQSTHSVQVLWLCSLMGRLKISQIIFVKVCFHGKSIFHLKVNNPKLVYKL